MESIWQKDSKLPSFPQQRENKKTDVLIIGGGIAGILTAYFLKQNHVDCMLVEKGRICNGTTAGTTAKITVQHGLLYHRLLRGYGAEYAQKYLQANQHAFTCYEMLCKKIDCDYEYQDMLIALIGFSEGKIAPSVKEGLKERMAFDAEKSKGALKRRSQQIIDNLN